MRHLLLSVLVALFLVTPALAQEKPKGGGAASSVVATKPSFVCPETELGDEALQARYTEMWEQFSEEMEQATEKLQAEIDEQTKSATESGNLDLALFWAGVGKEFQGKGEVKWDEALLKKEWTDRFGDQPFPSKFGTAVRRVASDYRSVTRDLERGYEGLVMELTKAMKLEMAVKVRGEIKELIKETGATSEVSRQLKSDPASTLGLKGKVEYNAKTQELAVRYDFSTPTHLEDFSVTPQQSVASIRQGQLIISPNGVLTHKVEYEAISISGKLILPVPRGEKNPTMRLGVSADRSVFAYGGGSIRTKDGWVDSGGVKVGQPTRFRWIVGSPQMSLWAEGKQGSLPCNLSPVGGAILEGSDQGCAFSELLISGRVTDAVADELKK